MTTDAPIKRALLSVSNKTGIVELAQQLHALQVELLSTGGTAKLLREHNIPVIDVSEVTDFPEMMDGRVKTLHPKIHGALLARPGIDDKSLQTHNITPINLVVVNLYPFEETVSDPDCILATAFDNIDIGGPTMIRSAAKNYTAVTVVVDAADYGNVAKEMQTKKGCTTLETRFTLAKKAFAHTARYDGTIANHLGKINQANDRTTFPETINSQFLIKEDLRYGENPHQKAAFYVERQPTEASIATAKQLQGKALSYNNIADTDAALECVKAFTDQPACVIVKHANPCGVALGDTQLAAYERAFATDPTSSFGGIIAFNKPLDAETAKAIVDRQFVEVIIAPDIPQASLDVLSAKPNVRALSCGTLPNERVAGFDCKRVNGGLLVQDRDLASITSDEVRAVTKRKPTDQEMRDLLFAWKVVKSVKSNAIVYARDNATIGIGAGQMSRIISTKIAAMKAADANLNIQNAVLASDAFFPFRDNVDIAAEVGIVAIIQPGGSIRDEEVIQAADEANIAMLFTGVRHFLH